MAVFIRHATDKIRNKKYWLDPAISIDALKEVAIMVKKLTSRYGFPSQIECSPFRRTYQTAVLIQQYLKKRYNKNVEIHVNMKLRRHIGNWEQYKKSCHRECVDRWEKVDNESIDDYLQRIRKYIKGLLKENETPIWYVTHAHYLKQVAKHVGCFWVPDFIAGCSWVNTEDNKTSF